jgi:hypothetical protein
MLNNITIFRTLLLLVATSVIVSSCSKDEDNNDSKTTANVVLSGSINANRTLSADTIYELAGYVVVDSGATLTINEGTIIKAREGSGAAASALIIARGSKINAVGTSAKPIIFTSVLDNITVGQKFGTNLTKDNSSLWGGLILLGNAKVSTTAADTEGQIEGIPADYTFGLYGGTNDADNSGSLSFVSIRHSGTELKPDQELQGLTLGGVGSATTINHVEIFASSDDGIEIFGGAAVLSDILVVYCQDDALDFDQNYSGSISNFLVIHAGASAGNAGLEIDGPEGSTYTSGKFTLNNGTVKNPSSATGRAATLKSAAQGTINNVAFTGFTNWVSVEGGSANANFQSGELEFTNSQFVKSSIASTITSSDSTLTAALNTILAGGSNTAVTTPTVGATQSVFASWTWASNANLLD